MIDSDSGHDNGTNDSTDLGVRDVRVLTQKATVLHGGRQTMLDTADDRSDNAGTDDADAQRDSHWLYAANIPID